MASSQGKEKKPQRRSGQSIKEVLKKYSKELKISELDSLLALSLKKNKEYLYKNPEKILNRSQIKTFEKLINKRRHNWPLAYLKGYKEFYGFKFLVSKHTLIPRPESELIVEEALKYIKTGHRVLDVGTGSGCLILSLAKKNKQPASYLATDISLKALKIAKTNARKLSLKNEIKFIKSNLFSKLNPTEKFDIILANLPYLTPKELQELSIKKEPRSALLAGDDGLNHYYKFLEQVPNFLNKKYLILLEINPTQKELIKKAVENNLPKANITFIKDLAQKTRIVKISSK